jgi:hypothetical protein
MQFSSNDFAYDGHTGVFSAEISDLSQGGQRMIWHRLWKDSADCIDIVSARTGETVRYAITTTIRDGEGDVLGWELLPVSGSVDGAEKTRVRIYND